MSARINVRPIGNLGNQMLQFMLTTSLESRLPELEVGGFEMSEWGLQRQLATPLAQPPLTLTGQYIDVPLLEEMLRDGRIRELELAALGFRMSHYLPREAYVKYFPRSIVDIPEVVRTGLVINVRGAEILANTHEDYGPIPIAFYRQLVNETGLHPVLMGQIGDDEYSKALLQAFPTATLLRSAGPMYDFELIRSARHVVASVSTFSWLATWLSEAETIHLPVFGIFNPIQRGDIDLLPVDDDRYRFHEFPERLWAGTAAQFQDLLRPQAFRALPVQVLRERVAASTIRIKPMAERYRRRLRWGAWLARQTGWGKLVRPD